MTTYEEARRGEMLKLHPLDTAGTNPINYILEEIHTVVASHDNTGTYVVPKCAPFFIRDFKVEFKAHQSTDWVEWTQGVEYEFMMMYRGAVESLSSIIYGSIEIKDQTASGILRITYRTMGGDQILDTDEIYREIVEKIINPRRTHWDYIAKSRCVMPPKEHDHNAEDTVGYDDVVEALNLLATNMAGNNAELILTMKEYYAKFDPCKFEYMFNALADHSFIEIVNRMQLLEEKQRELMATLMFEKYMDIIEALDKYSFADLVERMDKVEAEFEELKRALDIDKILELLDALEGVDIGQLDVRVTDLEKAQTAVNLKLKEHDEALKALEGASAKQIEHLSIMMNAMVDWHCDIMDGFNGAMINMVEIEKMRDGQKAHEIDARKKHNEVVDRLNKLENK